MGNSVMGREDDEEERYEERKKKSNQSAQLSFPIEHYFSNAPPNLSISEEELSQKGENDLLEMSKQLYRSQKYQEAVYIVSKVIALNSSNDDAFNVRGSILLALKSFDLSKEDLDRALSINPLNVKAHFNTGSWLKFKGDIEQSILYFKKCMELDPTFIASLVSLGNIYFEMKKFDEARNYYEQAVQKDPQMTMALHNLGAIERNIKDLDKALEYFERVIAIDPNFLLSINSIGDILMEKGEIQKSLEFYQRGLMIKKNFSSYFGIAQALGEMGQYQKAIENLNIALQMDATKETAYVLLCNFYKKLKNFDYALNVIAQGKKVFPNSTKLLIAESSIYFEQKKYQQGIEVGNILVRINPNLFEAYINRGNCYYGLNQLDAAFEDYNFAVNLNGDSPKAWGNRGTIYCVRKDFERSLKDFQKAYSLNPKDEFFKRKLIACCTSAIEDIDQKSSSGQFMGMEENNLNLQRDYFVTELKKYEPNWVDVFALMKKDISELTEEELISRGGTSYDSGKVEDARLCFERVVTSVNDKNEKAHNGLGACFLSLKQSEKALECFNKAIELNPSYMKPHQLKGDVYKELKLYIQALECYDAALKIDPTSYKCHHDKGVVYFHQNSFDMAIKEFSTTIQMNPRYYNAYSNRGESLIKLNRYQEAYKDFCTSLSIQPNNPNAQRGKARCENLFKLQQTQQRLQQTQQRLQAQPRVRVRPTVTFGPSIRVGGLFGAALAAKAMKDQQDRQRQQQRQQQQFQQQQMQQQQQFYNVNNNNNNVNNQQVNQ